MTDPTIVPFGGLRPVVAGSVHPLVEYVLSLSENSRPKVGGIMTATGDASEYIVAFYSRFRSARAEPSHLALFSRTVTDITAWLLDKDIVFVGGGNTASMLAVWRAHGVDSALRAAWEAGVILCGGSAGSLCWFECGTTDSFDLARLAPLHDGLGFLPGSHCPHYDGEAQRRPLYHSLIADGFPAGYAIDEDAAIHFSGTAVHSVLSARAGATAYRVERVNGAAVETPLAARALT